MLRTILMALASGLLIASVASEPLPRGPRLGGGDRDYATQARDATAFLTTAEGLDPYLSEQVSSGRRLFNEPWILPSEFLGVWGLGPTFNEVGCPQCHASNGRARAPNHGMEVSRGLLLRLSIPGVAPDGGPRPHPQYGDQLQNRGVPGRVPAEGRAVVRYTSIPVMFADGSFAELRKPSIVFTSLAFGDLGAETMLSPRIAPSLIGLGLLEAVPEESLLALARDQAEHGMTGKLNIVRDIASGELRPGRFGWKAGQPHLTQQIAAAFHADIGATSPLYPAENCPEVQTQCASGPTATGCPGAQESCPKEQYWEVSVRRLQDITTYLRAVTVPARRHVDDPLVRRGERLFLQAKCDICHVPSLRTGPSAAMPWARTLTISPFTDLLLHDMGPGLADNRPEFLASGTEWRTPPLWGLGLQPAVNGHLDLLHDGRARDFVEAILWHDGQAASSREHFRHMSAQDREAMIKFLGSI